MTSSYFDSDKAAAVTDFYTKGLKLPSSLSLPETPDWLKNADYGWDKAGKFNETAENLKKDPLGKSGSSWGQALGLAGSFLQEAKDKGKQDEAIRKLPYALGKGTGGFGGQILDNFGVVMPQQHGPIVLPGVGGQSSGMGSKIGRFAGAALGAVIGGPAGMAIGGTLGGGAGSFFD